MSDTTHATHTPHLLKDSARPLQQQYRLALLDLDGVVYRGKNPVVHAADSITAAAQAGMIITYTTNNPSRTPQTVADQIAHFGVSVRPEQIITSALVAARLLQKRLPRGAKVYVCGGDPLKQEISAHGLTVVDSADDHPQAVIAGWFPNIGWKYLAQACIAIENGAQFFATNRDLTLPREKGITPGIGAFINAIRTTTGQDPVASAGKPESAMYDEEREIYAEEGDDLVPVSASLPVGDRLDTDIEAANRGGYDSLCVLTGVSDAHQLMCAEPILRPTFISADLRGLAEVHHAPRPVSSADQPVSSADSSRSSTRTTGIAGGIATAFSCGSMMAQFDGSSSAITIHSTRADEDPASSIDALRAACQLCWSLADSGYDLSNVTLPHFEL